MTERVIAVGKHSGGHFELEPSQLMAGNVDLYDIKKLGSSRLILLIFSRCRINLEDTIPIAFSNGAKRRIDQCIDLIS